MNVDRMVILIAAGLAVATVQAQMSLESEYRSTGKEMMRVFEPQRQVLQVSSALLLEGRDESGYGVVVSAEGHILVKASEFERLKEPEVVVDRKRYKGVKLLASDQDWDVSLIKIDASGLVPVDYAPTSDVATGTWVVSNGATSRLKRRALMGVVSAKVREIRPLGGLVLGVVIDPKDGKLEVREVTEGGGAEAAGIKEGDLLLGADGIEFKQIEDLMKALEAYRSGDRVAIRVGRDEGEEIVEVELGTRDETFKAQSRNDQMSGDVSLRRSDFPRAIQHSILGNSKSVGGPLLDLDGRCLGMNIARANRAESYAIPVEELKELAARLMEQGEAPEAP